MKEVRVSLDELEGIEKVENNLFIDSNDILLQKGMQLDAREIELLKKWKIHHLVLKDQLSISSDSFSSLFSYSKEHFAKNYDRLKRWTADYYMSVGKEYKVTIPTFRGVTEDLFKMGNRQTSHFLFYMHTHQNANNLETMAIRSAIYAFFIAKRLGLDFDEANSIFSHAIVSEIGYLKKSEQALGSAVKKDPPEPLDFQYLRAHTAAGFEIATQKLGYSKEDAITILTHHDYVDGTGFNSLSGDKLPLRSLIITLAQEFCYITTDFISAYSPTFDLSNAIIQIIKKRNRYKKEVLDAFLSVMSFYPPGVMLYINDDTLAFSTGTTSQNIDRPNIEVVASANGKPLPEQKTLNLAKEKNLDILGIVTKNNMIKKITKHVYGK